MNKIETVAQLRSIASDWGLHDVYSYCEEAFSRNLGFFDAGDFDRLIHSKVAIPGLGGVGGLHVATMARSGVGIFNLADMDVYEPANMNRQFGAKVQTFGSPKLDVMVNEALSINPYITVNTFPGGLTDANLDEFLAGVDVVVDGLDFFAFDIRRALFNRAYERGIPVVTAGPLGFSSALLVFTAKGMSFDEYFDVVDGMPERRKHINFAMGLAPSSLHSAYMDFSAVDLAEGRGPSLNIGCQMSAALAGTEALRILLDRGCVKAAPYYIQFDPYRRKFCRGKLRKGNKSKIQSAKRWFLETVLLERAKRTGCEPVHSPGLSMTNPAAPDLLKYLVKAGIQAPSGDNVQPWRFVLNDSSIDVFMNATADDSFFNVRNYATLIATGAAIENMVIASSACGVKAEVEYAPDGANTELVATIKLDASSSVNKDRLSGAIWRRHTNRKPFSKRALPDGLCGRFAEVAREGGGDLRWVNTSEGLRRLADALFIADRIRLEREDLHRHFIKMVRFSEEDVQKTRDGLPLKNLEAGLFGELFLRMTKSWGVMRAANFLGFSRVGAKYAASGIVHSGGAGLLTVPGTTPKDFVVGGRALERVWLTLTHYNLRMQPMTAVTLFRLRWLLEGPEVFSSKHQRMLLHVWGELAALFPDVWKHGPVMLFRAGFGKPMRHGTHRRLPESFLPTPL